MSLSIKEKTNKENGGYLQPVIGSTVKLQKCSQLGIFKTVNEEKNRYFRKHMNI